MSQPGLPAILSRASSIANLHTTTQGCRGDARGTWSVEPLRRKLTLVESYGLWNTTLFSSEYDFIKLVFMALLRGVVLKSTVAQSFERKDSHKGGKHERIRRPNGRKPRLFARLGGWSKARSILVQSSALWTDKGKIKLFISYGTRHSNCSAPVLQRQPPLRQHSYQVAGQS